MKFSELSRRDEIGILSISGLGDADLSDPRYDSRHVTKGSTFFAIKGFSVDGHSFIPTALANGATCIVLEDESRFTKQEAEERGVTCVVVKSARKALAVISEEVFGNPSTKLRLIGVTGTNGKTTTTNILKQLLEARGETVGLIGTIGIWIADEELPATHTTPESRELSELLAVMVSRGVTTCVMEVSSHALALERVAGLQYDIAVFTNLTQDHLDFHKSMDEYFAAKQLLFNHLGDTAVAVSNADDRYGEAMIAHTVANSHTYGILKSSDPKLGHADLFATNLELTLNGMRFTLNKRYSEERAEIETPLIGKFNVENVLAAASALYFGISGYSLEVLSTILRDISPIRGRFERVELATGGRAVIDYAHTPDALEHVLHTLDKLKTEQSRVVTVFGCGGDRDRMKRPQMGRIAAELSDLVFVTNDNPRTEEPMRIIDEIMDGVPQEFRSRCRIVEDRARAIQMALDEAGPADVVLVAGKGHETYQIFGKETTHFDDREEVMKWNSERMQRFEQ